MRASPRPASVTPLRGRGRRYLAIISKQRHLSVKLERERQDRLQRTRRHCLTNNVTPRQYAQQGEQNSLCIPLLPWNIRAAVTCTELETRGFRYRKGIPRFVMSG
jgi:hypothetical protein